MINQNRSLPEPGTPIGGWEVVRRIGQGGMAVVYEVTDPSGRSGALKLSHPRTGDRAEAEERFRRERRALVRMAHRNIVAVLDHGTWEGRDWFVMELVAGRDLRAEVEAWELSPPGDRWARVREILADVARALAAVHATGLVHRDLTPGNVMLREDGSACLMDFGVAKETSATETGDDELTSHGELLGTVAWIAPEQIVGEDVDARADLYSLGALLFWCLTGRRPFHARTLAGYLDKHLHRAVRPPRELVPAVPEALDALCVRLLEKDPDLRCGSAEAVLLELGVPPDAVVNLARWPERPFGRLQVRCRLSAAVAACAEGHGGVVVIEGGAGLGRSTLSRHVAVDAGRAGLRVHTLVGGGASGALDAFRPLVESLANDVADPPHVIKALLGAFGEGAVVERFAVFQAVRGLLAGSPPRVVVIDDAHRLDATSLELLEYLIRTTRGLAQEAILYVLTRAPDGAGGGLASGTATGVRPTILTLGPMKLQAVEELVGSLVGTGPAVRALAARLHAEGEGNPAFIAEMVRGLVEERVIDGAEGVRHLTVDEGAVARLTLPIPRSAREALIAQVAALDPAAVDVVRVLALARQELSLDAVAATLRISPDALPATADRLVAAGLVRERRVEGALQIDVAQARLREVVDRETPPDVREVLHRRLGETLERVGRGRLHLVVDALALHFEAGGVPTKAYHYLLRSGARLLDRSFTREALDVLDRAVALEPRARDFLPLDEADRALADLLLKRCEVLEAVGEWGRLDADLARAQDLADALADEGLQARARAGAGRRARQQGDLVRAADHFHAALSLAERAGDAATRAFVLNQLGTVFWACGDLDSARRHWVEGLAVAEGARDERSIGYGYNGLGMVAACRGQAAESRRNFEQAAAVFERVGLSGPLTWARGNLVEVHLCTGNLRRGLELAEKNVAHAREVNHPAGIVLARAGHADVLTHLGRAAEGRAEAEAALALARTHGDPGEIFTAIIPLMRSLWAIGAAEPLNPLVEEALGLAAEVDHEGWLGILHAWRARLFATAGDAAGARAEVKAAMETAGPRWPYQEVRLDLSLARVHALLGDAAEAVRHADAAIRRADACGYRLYVLKGHMVAAAWSTDEAAVARHKRVADALGRALAANLAGPDAERFASSDWLRS